MTETETWFAESELFTSFVDSHLMCVAKTGEGLLFFILHVSVLNTAMSASNMSLQVNVSAK